MENSDVAPVVVERLLAATPARVWQALTDKDQMKDWYFEVPAFRPEVGVEFQFTGGTEEKSYLHLCRITQVEPGAKLSHTWDYQGYAGESQVSFELLEEGPATTRLRLTHSGLETFPASNPDFARENFMAGWHDIISRSLPAYLQQQL